MVVSVPCCPMCRWVTPAVHALMLYNINAVIKPGQITSCYKHSHLKCPHCGPHKPRTVLSCDVRFVWGLVQGPFMLVV